MQRGEVWEYDPVMRRDGRSTLRLILSADGWVADPEHRIVHGVHLLTEDQGGLVNVRTSLGSACDAQRCVTWFERRYLA